MLIDIEDVFNKLTDIHTLLEDLEISLYVIIGLLAVNVIVNIVIANQSNKDDAGRTDEE